MEMKRIILTIEIFFRMGFCFAKSFYKEPRIMQKDFTLLMIDMFRFLEKANNADTPMSTKWTIDTGEDTVELLQLWAAKGELTPLKRIDHLIDERNNLQIEIRDRDCHIKALEESVAEWMELAKVNQSKPELIVPGEEEIEDFVLTANSDGMADMEMGILWATNRIKELNK